MTELKPLSSTNSTGLKKPQRWFLKDKLKILFHHKYLVIVLVLILGVFWWSQNQESSVFKYVFGQSGGLKITGGRVNVLLLGIAGGNHDGPNLTDTIMVASYDRKTNRANLISLPRDLWIDKHKAKVNALYQIGLDQDDGLGLAKKEIGEILGLDIPYVVRLDFNGFIKAIDLVGGIDVNVAQTFDDYAYPIAGKEKEMCGYEEKQMDLSEEQAKALNISPGKYLALLAPDGKIATTSAQDKNNIEYQDTQVLNYFNCRFEHLSFKQGLTHMDGITALKFVRSRHSVGAEGTDFARSRRQQLALQAFKDKVLSLNTLADPRKVVELVKTFGSSVDTNVSPDLYVEFIKLAKEFKGAETAVIDSGGNKPLLISPPVGEYGAWVLVPPERNFTQIQQFIQDNFAKEATASADKK